MVSSHGVPLRPLPLLLAMIAFVGLSTLATAGAQSQETFHLNVSSAQTPVGQDAWATDPVEISVPEETERLVVQADWIEASDAMEIELVEERCDPLCQRESVAATRGPTPAKLALATPNATKLTIDIRAAEGAAVDRGVRGVVTYIADTTNKTDGGETESQASAPLSPSPSLDSKQNGGPSATVVAAGVVGLAAALSLFNRLVRTPAPFLALYHRVRDAEDLLDHPTRKAIYDYIEDAPGVHFEQLARELDMGRGNLDHHLVKLVGADLLEERRVVGYRAYFRPGGVPRRLQEPLVLLKTDGARRLVRHADGQAGVRELARRTGLAPSTISHHVDRLSEAGLLSVNEDRSGMAIEATRLAERTLTLLSS